MNPIALAALKESIKHWERLASGRRRKGESIGPNHCALCKYFHIPKGRDWCEGCPVSEHTGLTCCEGTPYNEVDRLANTDDGLDSVEFKRAAAKELAFLKSLLPKTKKKGRKK